MLHIYIRSNLILFLLFGLASNSFANATMFSHGNGTSLATDGTVQYLALNGDLGPVTVVSDAEMVVPVSGVLKILYSRVSANPNNGGGTQSYTFTVRLNGADTAITCAASETTPTCSDVTNEVSVVAGDLINLEVVSSGTPTAGNQTGALNLYSTSSGGADNSTALMGISSSVAISATVTNYLAPMTYGDPTTVEGDAELLVAADGVLKNFYIALDGDPDNGAGTQSYAFTVRTNEANISITCTVSDGSTTCTDLTNTAAVTAGQRVSISCVPANTPTVRIARFGLVFVPDIEGLFLTGMLTNDDLNATTVEYNRRLAQGVTWNATESARDTITGSAVVVRTIYVQLTVAPANGAGTQSFAFQTRFGAVSNGPGCTIEEAATTCNSTTEYSSPTLTQVAIRATPASTPAVSDAMIGLAWYIRPARRVFVE